MKTCTKCKQAKLLSEFYTDKRRPDGATSRCRVCLRKHVLEYQRKNYSVFKARWDEWRESNKEQVLRNSRNWTANNRERSKEIKDKWAAAHPEDNRQAKTNYQKDNPEQGRLRVAKRRSAKKNATPLWASGKAIEEVYFAADFLGMVTGEWYHVDHIVPLQSKLVCGLHCEANLQVLPASANWAKGNRHWPDMP